MAFCKNCGTKLEEGVKFCPKCGNPTDGDVSTQKPTESSSLQKESKSKGCLKKAIIAFFVMGFLGFLAEKCGGGAENQNNDSNAPQATEQVVSENQETETNENSGLNGEEKKVAEEGYRNGYNQGFRFDELSLANYDEKIYKDFARSSYTVFHKAPSTSEETKRYELYEQNFLRGIADGIKAQRGTQNTSNEFLEKGHTYESPRYRVKLAAVEHYCQYVLSLYNDGSVILVETGTYPNHEYDDWTKTFECKMAKKIESKRDIKKEWYQIEGKYQNEATTLLIDMKGNVYGYFGKNAFEAVGDGECYKTTFKRIK